MNTIEIILLTLVVYSLIGTLIYLLSGESDHVLEIFGLGVIGIILVTISKIVNKVRNYLRYHYNKRSIFKDKNTDNLYKCKTSDANDIVWHNSNYKMIKRYANKEEWQNAEDFPKALINQSKRNCNRCKYNDKCTFEIGYSNMDKIKCKHNKSGVVTEFDKFEKK